jgi:alkanesulfonate monooxygenase SsuD/methylene tetrahydromethanopterin reductase-like flavin-dependent oxidoreductase (luciferase family)
VQDDVPLWVAARSPITFDYAVANNANIMSWPLTMPFAEAEKYRAQLDEAIAKAPTPYTGTFAMMRHTAIYENETDRQAALGALRHTLGQFGNLMQKKGEVINGFPERVPNDQLDGNMRYDPETLEENLMFGSAEQAKEKLSAYRDLGVDAFIYYASMGLDMETQKRSLSRFIDRVMPHFA